MTLPDDDRLFEVLPEAASFVGSDYVVNGQNEASRAEYGPAVGRPCHLAFFGRETPCQGCLAPQVLRRGRAERWFMTVGGAPGERGTSYYEITALTLPGRPGFIEILRDVTAVLGVEYSLLHDSERLEAEIGRQRAEAEQLERRTVDLQNQLRALQDARAEVLQTEKLASIGRLAAGIAHEVHTPLGTILASLDLLGRRITRLAAPLEMDENASTADEREAAVEALQAEVPKLRELLKLLSLAAERIRTIVGSLRLFAHLDRAELETVDPRDGIEAALTLLGHELRGRIDVVREYEPIPGIACRPDAMNQVYMNLLQNAVQAIAATGTITISTRPAGPGHVEIAIRDTGHGISPELLPRIFEPGFTSKPRGIGTGLGLAIVYRTVADHGGTIGVLSTPGEGATFTLRMPIRGTV